MKKPDLFLENGVIVTENSKFFGGVVVSNGVIERITSSGETVEAREIIDLGGKYLLPGLVDGHVHFHDPGRDYWEGYRTGTMAAAAGGVTTVVEMPLNGIPPTIDREKLAVKREIARINSVVDYAHWGGMVTDNLEHLPAMAEEGVVGYKAFTGGVGTPEFTAINDHVLFNGLRLSKELGNVVDIHAENESITSTLKAQLKTAGRKDRQAWYDAHPIESELEPVERAIFFAKATGGNLHLAHTSIPDGVRAVARAKSEGVNVTIETCPHYLVLDLDDFLRIGPEAKCVPPIRFREEVERMWQCIFEGLVDTIASDHSPCTNEEKDQGMDNIWQAWGGITGIQTMLPAILTEGVHKRGLPITTVARLMASTPARIFGLYPKKGSLQPGADADFVVVDLDREWTFPVDQILSKNKHSLYVGFKFKGAIECTMVRGKTVSQGGRICVAPGYGQLQVRGYRYRPILPTHP
jgi:allantoinase